MFFVEYARRDKEQTKFGEFLLRTFRSSLLSSRLLSRNVKVKIYKTIILPVVLYGCETWSLTLKEEDRGCLRTGSKENIWT